MDIFELLDRIRERPSMYVGASNADRGGQLHNLELVLQGYVLAVQGHAIAEPVTDFPREFAAYLRQTLGWSAAAGPVAAVLSAAQNDEEAWTLFWKLIGEFRAVVTK